MPAPTPPATDWWKSAVVYQIYPRSFADSDGDGIGDLPGVLQHLDHLSWLGIDVVWLSPVYRSPQDDHGYDISDYRDVDPTFGTLADLDRLIAALHARGIRLLMDLVVNHTSDEHAWFEESRASRENPRADWYIWRDPRPGAVGGEPGAEPNNWGSFFSGSAWEWEPARGQYYLHLFSRKQPDLDWEQPAVREAVFSMMSWWLDRGVDGFRMDVVNFLSKDPALPDGELLATGYGDGTPHFRHGPRLHEHLSEMQRVVFAPRTGSYLTVGEMPMVTPEEALAFTDAETGQLSMVFQFEHVDLDSEGDKWTPRETTVADLRHSWGRWQDAMGERGWNSLYWENHDQPRVVSRFGDVATCWRESATALATMLHLHRGTPYVFQGQELGMTNVPFDDIADFRDIESLHHYAAAVERGAEPAQVLAALRSKSRDNARTPVQWSGGPTAGFTAGEPWIAVNPNTSWLNAEAQRDDPGSVLAYYRELIALRHRDDVVVHGAFALLPGHRDLYAFSRTTPAGRLGVYVNLSSNVIDLDLDPADAGAEVVLANYPAGDRSTATLAPWEARVLRSGPHP
ncbi:MAG: alpha-glucosidase [Nocardioides sp.]|nr:alpha-glucosidase [Nocardioides sp.]